MQSSLSSQALFGARVNGIGDNAALNDASATIAGLEKSLRFDGGKEAGASVESRKVIKIANEVFGNNGWNSSIANLSIDYIDYDDGSKRYNVGGSANVRVTLRGGVYREEVGYGKVEGEISKGAAVEKCKKEAVSDGLKRALQTFEHFQANFEREQNTSTPAFSNAATLSRFDEENANRRSKIGKEYLRDPVMVGTVPYSCPPHISAAARRTAVSPPEILSPETKFMESLGWRRPTMRFTPPAKQGGVEELKALLQDAHRRVAEDLAEVQRTASVREEEAATAAPAAAEQATKDVLDLLRASESAGEEDAFVVVDSDSERSITAENITKELDELEDYLTDKVRKDGRGDVVGIESTEQTGVSNDASKPANASVADPSTSREKKLLLPYFGAPTAVPNPIGSSASGGTNNGFDANSFDPSFGWSSFGGGRAEEMCRDLGKDAPADDSKEDKRVRFSATKSVNVYDVDKSSSTGDSSERVARMPRGDYLKRVLNWRLARGGSPEELKAIEARIAAIEQRQAREAAVAAAEASSSACAARSGSGRAGDNVLVLESDGEEDSGAGSATDSCSDDDEDLFSGSMGDRQPVGRQENVNFGRPSLFAQGVIRRMDQFGTRGRHDAYARQHGVPQTNFDGEWRPSRAFDDARARLEGRAQSSLSPLHPLSRSMYDARRPLSWDSENPYYSPITAPQMQQEALNGRHSTLPSLADEIYRARQMPGFPSAATGNRRNWDAAPPGTYHQNLSGIPSTSERDFEKERLWHLQQRFGTPGGTQPLPVPGPSAPMGMQQAVSGPSTAGTQRSDNIAQAEKDRICEGILREMRRVAGPASADPTGSANGASTVGDSDQLQPGSVIDLSM